MRRGGDSPRIETMKTPLLLKLALAVIGGAFVTAGICAPAAPAGELSSPGSTRVARWKDDKTAAFLVMFDDSWPSHWQVAAPELVKRGLIATFYINPGKGEYQKFAKEWEEKLWKQGMVYGDHTMTHKGVKDLADAEREIGDCAALITRVVPGRQPRLLSYGQPGVGKGDWNITGEELDGLLRKHHLISRPDFRDHGTVYHLKTAAEMLALADKAIRERGREYVIIHGVERITPDWHYQDFWPLKQDILRELLDGLQARLDKDELWITDHISAHQYETERTNATVRVLEAGAGGIKLQLDCTADPQFYDLPLTLVTRTPAAWKAAMVAQGTQEKAVAVEKGTIRFDARPGGEPIRIRRADRE